MPTTLHTRLRGLDTLRALAILAVMLYHLAGRLPESWGPVANWGWMGVDLFFVLSGYLIGGQLLRPVARGQAPDLLSFIHRRAFRILPAYVVVLAFYVLVPAWRESAHMAPLWQFITFTENLFVDHKHYQAFSNVWSLCVEEHFYLLLPLVVLWWRRKPTAARMLASAGAVLLLGLATRSYVLLHWLRPTGVDNDDFGHLFLDKMYYPTYTRLDGLLFGVCLAWLQLFRPALWAKCLRWSHALGVAGVSLVEGAMWLLEVQYTSVTGRGALGDVLGYPLLAAGLALLVASALSPHSLLGRWRVPGAQSLAVLAYSLYLLHKPIAHLDGLFLPGLSGGRDARAAAVFALTSLLAAVMLYGGVERPFLRWRERGTARPVTRSAAARLDPAL